MADIRLTEGNDTYVQPESAKDNWDNYFGLGGNDSIKIFNGTVVGGPGNDVIEKIPTPGESWRTVGVAYWDSPTGVRVDLQGGWAEDGYGGRDSLIGVDVAHGNWRDDWFNGNGNDNFFWGNGGNDTVNGGDGIDIVGVNDNFMSVDGSRRAPVLDELDIWVSADGRMATIKPKASAGTGFSYTLTDVERFELHKDGYSGSTTYQLSDFITLQTMAEEAIAAGPTLRWNPVQPLGSTATVTFSFVKSAPASGVGVADFRVFTTNEQQLVRDILAKTSAMAGINFMEVADSGSSNGQIRFGVSQQSATKGVSWLPNQTGAGDLAGDVWMDVESMVGIAPGTEGFAALLHEIGHALGLRHPRNVDAGDNWAMQLRSSDDRTALTVMSSVQSSDGLFRSDWAPLDVLALRYLYGSRDVSLGDSIYILGSVQAGSQTTIMDSGGTDTLDASAYSTGVNINLRAGGLSNVGLTSAGFAGVENLGIAADTWIENVIGSRFDDVLSGNDLDNRFIGSLGNDWIEGGKGVDTAVFAGNLADYILSYNFGKIFAEAADGVSGFDTLIDVEKLAFADQVLSNNSLTVSGAAIVGNALTAVNLLSDVNSSTAMAFQWQENGKDIAGATGSTHVLTASQLGKTIAVTASYVNASGALKSVTSNAPGTVIAVSGQNVNGSAGNDTLKGGAGNDTLNGGLGSDTAVYAGSSTQYFVTFDSANSNYKIQDSVAGRDGTDALTSIESIQFLNGVKQIATADALTVARVHQSLFGKALGHTAFNDYIAKVGSGSLNDWLSGEASAFSKISDSAFSTLVLNNISINNSSLISTAAFGTSQQAYDSLQQALANYLTAVGVANRGVVAGQLAQIIAGFEGETTFGVYGGAATAFNKQVGSNIAHSFNAQNSSAIAAVPIFAAGAVSANAMDYAYMVAPGNYAYQISGFGSGDKIVSPAGVAATLLNNSYSDGIATVQYGSGGQTVSVTLVGLSNTQDFALRESADFNSVFGAGTFV